MVCYAEWKMIVHSFYMYILFLIESWSTIKKNGYNKRDFIEEERRT